MLSHPAKSVFFHADTLVSVPCFSEVETCRVNVVDTLPLFSTERGDHHMASVLLFKISRGVMHI